MKNRNKEFKRRNFFLIYIFFLTTILNLIAFKNINIQDIKITGSELFSKNDIVQNSSLIFPSRLVFIKTKLLERELKKNLSLENISVNRQIFPFGLKILIKTRKPVAFGERTLDGEKIFGFVDENGFFINKKFADQKNIEELRIQVFGWEDTFRKSLSQILKSNEIDKVELVAINFSSNGFLRLEEKDLKTILLGFDQSLLKKQLQIISNIKNQLKEGDLLGKIEAIDLTDPINPKIKVFKR